MLDEKTGIDFLLYQKDVPEIFAVDDPNDLVFQRNFLQVVDFSEMRPHFDHLLDFAGNRWNYRIYMNWVMGDPTRRALRLIIERGLAQQLETFDGCHSIRPSKGGNQWSQHAYGLALDFNAASNQYGQEPTMDLGIVKCFAESGFEWGGLWSTPDGMHFQLSWIRLRTGPLAPVPWRA
jgi:hypothetical protein